MEGMPEGNWREKEYRADPQSDALEQRFEKVRAGTADDVAQHIEDTFDELMDNYKETEDPEQLRQATLLVTKLEELHKRWSQKIEVAD